MSTDRIAIEFISAFGMPPLDYVALADELGCRHIGFALAPFTANPHNYPAWSLRDDKALRRAFKKALVDHDVSVSLGEGFLCRPDVPVANMAGDLDLMAELGAETVNILSLDPERARSIEALATFTQMAKARGLQATLEFMPGMVFGDLATASAAVREIDAPNFRLLLDAMHVFRSGATKVDLDALDPPLIGYVQLCDVPLVSTYASYGEEARDNRLPLGAGELPWADLAAITPPNIIAGIETPMLDAARAGIGPRDRLAPSVAKVRDLLR